MISRTVTLIAVFCVLHSSAMLRGTGHQKRGKMQSDMRPEEVNQLLSNVEKKWVQGRLMLLRNVTDEASSYSTMEASCLKVSSAIVAGSEGEKDRVVEYMQDVCELSKESPTSSMCMEFASAVEGVMTDDESFNRDNLDLKPLCKKFWDHTIAAAAQAEKQKLDAEEAKREQEEEEAKKREEEEAAKEKATEEEKAKQVGEEAAEKAKEEAADEAKKAEEQKASNEQNTTQTQQSQNTTEAEIKAEASQSVEVPQTNATSAVAVESVTAPADASEPALPPAEEVKNVTVAEDASSEKPVAAESNETTNANMVAATESANSTKPAMK